MSQYCRRSRQKEKSIEIKLTQKGQENHYDVKYLHGYGSQISVKDQRIILKNGIEEISVKKH